MGRRISDRNLSKGVRHDGRSSGHNSSGSGSTARKLISREFGREEFLELVEIVKPRIVYHRKRMHFFSFDGFVMYTFECRSSGFKQRILEAIEFSN